MRKRPALAVSILILFATGCHDHGTSRPTAGKGDVREFILAQSLAFGGRPAKTNDLPPLSSEWSFQRDEIGMNISLPREEFPAVDVFLRHVFGPPSTGPIDTRNGNKFGSYDKNSAGCGIFYSTSATNCLIYLTRPMITSRDLPGFHRWTVRIGDETYGIYGDRTGSAIVIVQGSVVLPVPFWWLVTLAALSVLVIIAVVWLIIRRYTKAG